MARIFGIANRSVGKHSSRINQRIAEKLLGIVETAAIAMKDDRRT